MRRWLIAGLLLLVVSLWALLLWTPAEEQLEPIAAEADTLDPASPTPKPVPAASKPPAVREPQPELAEPAQAPSPPTASPTFKLPVLPPPEPSGPVTALKLRFGNESQTQAGTPYEQQLTASLQRTGPPPGSVDSVVCRRSVCRVSWQWKAKHVIPFYQAVGALRRDFDPGLAIDEAKPAHAEDARIIDIYLDISASKAHAVP